LSGAKTVPSDVEDTLTGTPVYRKSRTNLIMSTTATQSGGYAPESQRFVEWSNFNEKRWKYVGEAVETSETNIWSPDTNNAMTIRYDLDCRSGSQRWKRFKRLSEYNTGLRNGRKWTNQEYNTNLLNRHLIQALASQLDLHPRYQREAERLFMGLDLRKFGMNASIVALSACSAVVHSSERNERECHPCMQSGDIHSLFEQVKQNERYQRDHLVSLYNKLTQSIRSYLS